MRDERRQPNKLTTFASQPTDSMYFKALALVAFASSCHGQTTFLAGPETSWKTDFEPMGQGNGIVLAPDSSLLFATASDGTIGAIKPSDGTVEWTFKPTTDSTFLNANGEASVAADGSYLVYGVTENLGLPQETCKIVALSPSSGDLLWTSPDLEGTCQGTPHVSSSGEYIYVVHNSGASTVGHFTVLTSDDGAVLFGTTDTTAAFSPPGIFRNPIEGNFNTGRGNNQDVLMWSYAPDPDATSGLGGAVFAFQLPFNYVQDLGTDFLEVTTVIPNTGWRSTKAPLLTAGGLQLFWPVSRSQFRSWVGTRFSASSSGSASFDRGSPSFLAPQTTPAVDNDVTPAIICSATAAPEFVCMNAADINTGAIWSVDLAGLVLSNPLFSTEGDRVYFAEDRGVIFSVNPLTGEKYFEKSTGVPLVSNFVLSEDGAFLYYGDQIGNVVAWKVAEEAVPPTPAPIPLPTVSPAVDETTAPSVEAPGTTAAPTASPTISQTTSRVEPTQPSPTAAAPTKAPSTPATSGASYTAVGSAMTAVAVAVAAFV